MGNVHQGVAEDAAGHSMRMSHNTLRLGGCIAEACLPSDLMVRP